jgi:hypothetical protein
MKLTQYFSADMVPEPEDDNANFVHVGSLRAAFEMFRYKNTAVHSRECELLKKLEMEVLGDGQ